MKRTSIALLVILVASFGSAGVLSHYGIISGEASVTPPTFYLGSDGSLHLEEQSTSSLSNETYSYQFDTTRDWYAFNATINKDVDGFDITTVDDGTLTCEDDECRVNSSTSLDTLTFDIKFTNSPDTANITIEKIGDGS